MIKSDAHRKRTVAQIEGFRRALAGEVPERPGGSSTAIQSNYEGMIRQLEDELREYDELKAGKLKLPRMEKLDEMAASIAKIRMAKGITQLEVARRSGISEQTISRYEQSDYQTVGIARLQKILDAIGIKTSVTLSA